MIKLWFWWFRQPLWRQEQITTWATTALWVLIGLGLWFLACVA